MRGLREQPARVLANRPLEAAGKFSTGTGPIMLRVPRGQWLNPESPLPLGSRAQIFLASSELAHEETGRGECVPTCPGALQGSAPLGRFLCA